MRRGQRYLLVSLELSPGARALSPESWQAGLAVELEKILGRAGLGAAGFQFVGERRDGNGRVDLEKLGPGKTVLKCSVGGQRKLRGALALVTGISGSPARIRTVKTSGTLKGLLFS